MSLDFSSINPRYDIESIAKSLGEASPSGGGYSCLCPAHDDHSPSLSISLGNDGKLLLKCFVGCSFEDIIQALKHKNLLPDSSYNPLSTNRTSSPQATNQNTKNPSQHNQPQSSKLTVVKKTLKEQYQAIIPVPPEAPAFCENTCEGYNKKFSCKPSDIYTYYTAEGGIAQHMVRWNGIIQKDGTTKKETRPYVYAQNDKGRKSWISMGMPKPYPLYNLPEILKRSGDPVLVVEGEKTAERVKSLFPDYVVTTTMYGGKSPHQTDWSPLKGRNILISPDFDEVGQQYGDAVHQLCEGKSIQYLPIQKIVKELLGMMDTPPGYDLADAIEDGLKEALDQNTSLDNYIFPYITQIEKEAQNLPKDFRFDDRRNVLFMVMEKNKETGEMEEKWKFLCSYLVVTHFMRDGKSDEWARILKILDQDGVQKEFRMPMSLLAGDGNALKEKLLSLGVLLNFAATNTLKNYIAQSKPKERARAFDKTGWDGNCYILSEHKIYSPDDKNSQKKERLILNIEGYTPTFEQKGTLEEWQQTIGKYAIGNSRLQFSIIAALAAPLLKFFDEDNFGIHYFGSSSIGKSITLQVANSIWGKKVHTWRTTDNAAESLARSSNDGLLILDELSQVGADAADALAYMLGNGSGKARANKKGEARPISEFRLIFLSSGEIGLESKISESKGKKQIKAGQTVRFIEIPADAGKGMGVFENIHGFDNPGKFADSLKEYSLKYRGNLIDAWLDFITDNQETAVSQIKELRKRWIQNHPLEKKEGQVERVRLKIALLAAVGEYAVTNRFLPWEEGDASRVCGQILEAWLGQRGGLDSHEVLEVESRLLRFMEAHGSSRFEHVESKIEKEFWQEVSSRKNDNTYASQDRVPTLKNMTTHNRVGFRMWESISLSKQERDIFVKEEVESNSELSLSRGVVWQHYFLPEALEKEILQGGDKKLLLSSLAEKGLLVTFLEKTTDGKDKVRYSQNIRVPGYGQKRLYQINNKE